MKKIYNIVLATTFILLFGACSTKEKILCYNPKNYKKIF